MREPSDAESEAWILTSEEGRALLAEAGYPDGVPIKVCAVIDVSSP